MFNILSYVIYFAISIPITVYVGYKCFTVGKIYLLDLFKDIEICNAVNKILLIGYYLVNIGYIAFSISNWGGIANFEDLLRTVFWKLSIIFLLIAILHYINVTVLYYSRKKIISTFK